MEKNQDPRENPLTQEEEVEEVFNKFDTDGDGKISSTELAALLNVFRSSTAQEEVASIMAELDDDGDGFIDLNEFEAFYYGVVGKNEELKEAFNFFDQDKDGKISATELHVVLKSLGQKRSLKDCQRMINSIDVDGDGYVNFEEFKKMMTGAA